MSASPSRPSRIEERALALLANPAKIPLHVQQAEAFQLCSICPQRGTGDSCHAIRPVMAVWDAFDRYASYDPVKAVYYSGSDGTNVSVDTTVQRALQYVSVLCVMYDCEVGKKWWKYFYGVHPLMATEDLVVRIYLNMYWACGGDRVRTAALIERISTARSRSRPGARWTASVSSARTTRS